MARMLEGKFSGLRRTLDDGRRLGSFAVPFSSSHVEEAAGIDGPDREAVLGVRFDFLSGLTGNLYFVHDVFTLGFREEHPWSVYATLQEGDIGLDYKRLFANLISFDTLKVGREHIGLSSQQLNNLPPQEAVAAIDRALASAAEEHSPGYGGDLTFRGMIRTVSGIVRQHFAPTYRRLGMEPEDVNASSNAFVMAYSLFDSLGFWPDQRGTYEKGSRFGDALHGFYGSHCDYVVSEDRRFRNKSRATYAVVGSSATVLDAAEAETVLSSLLSPPLGTSP